MIAENRSRRKGLATEALELMMLYGITELGIRKFYAKIGAGNAPSLSLFERLGFEDVKFSEIFNEVIMLGSATALGGRC